MLAKLKELPMILKIVLSILIFIIVFIVTNKLIIGEKKNAIDEAYNEQAITLICVIITFAFYMIFFHKRKTIKNE